jgi:hypothetical protein
VPLHAPSLLPHPGSGENRSVHWPTDTGA